MPVDIRSEPDNNASVDEVTLRRLLNLCDHASAIHGFEDTCVALFRDDRTVRFFPRRPDATLPELEKSIAAALSRLQESEDPIVVVSHEVIIATSEAETQGLSYRWLTASKFASETAHAVGAFVIIRPGRGAPTDHELMTARLYADMVANILEIQQASVDLQAATEDRLFLKRSLVAAETRLAALADNVPGAIFEYVRDPDERERVRFMSAGCTEIWGYRQEEIESDPTPFWATILPEDLEAVKASIQLSQDLLTPWQHRWRIKNKSGYLRWLQSYGTPHRTDEGGVLWITLVLDVTVEQEAQISLAENTRLLHEAQKLESIGRLAGGLAHDFNNLLAVIVGNAEAINRTRLATDEQEAVDEIIEASQRGAHLVKQLLSFARKSDLRAVVVDVERVLADVDKLLRRVLPANISLEVSQRAGLWSVRLDKSMFENALLNLVINARDAMPNGGAITIEASNVRIDHEYVLTRDEEIRPGRYVMVAITDTGSGMDDALLPYVFEPFFTTKGPNGGSGLGLAMVQGFVRQSEGAVRVYSEVGHGTSIKMYFPASEAHSGECQGSETPLALPPRSKATVLLVEDDEGVRRVVEKIVLAGGYQVKACSSGDEAIAIYQQCADEIDIILTDVIMPGKIQGPQFVRLARKINHNVPVLYMSGYPHEANVHGNGIRPGDISLTKPVRRNELLAALGKLKRQL